MTSDHSGFVYEVGEWAPCPFCGVRLVSSGIADPNRAAMAHPGVMTDGDCMLSGSMFHVSLLDAWNRRAAPTPAEPSSPSLHAAIHAFLAKFDECKPHVDDAFLHRQLRCGPYTGPNYGGELEAMRAAHIAEASDVTLSTAEPSEEVERVARAVLAELGSGAAEFAAWADFPKSPSRDDLEEARYDGAFSPKAVARAAIAALRAPSGRVEKEVGSS